jgi:hypothetical protein
LLLLLLPLLLPPLRCCCCWLVLWLLHTSMESLLVSMYVFWKYLQAAEASSTEQ